MANWYVNSASTGTFNGTTWATACSKFQQLTGVTGGTYAVGATTITMSQNVPVWISSGMSVWDATRSQSVGTVSSYVGTLLTLSSATTSSNGGGTNSFQFGGPTGAPAVGDNIFLSTGTTDIYTAATTFNLPGTSLATPLCLYSASTANEPPTSSNLSPGATIRLTSTSISATATISPILNSNASYWYGITFASGTSTAAENFTFSGTNSQFSFDTCTFDMSASGGTAGFFNISGLRNFLKNPTFTFGAVGQSVNFANGTTYIFGGILNSSVAVPTNFFSANAPGEIYCEGFDFTGMSSRSLVPAGAALRLYWFKDCLVSTANVQTSPSFGSKVIFTRALNTVGSVTNFGSHFAAYDNNGTEIAETSVTRVGGAADTNGNLFSKKITTATNTKPQWAFITTPMTMVYTGATGSAKTVTVYGTIDSSVYPNNNDIWIDVEYPGSSVTTLGSFTSPSTYSGFMNSLSASTPISSDAASTWNGGLSSGKPFILTTSFTPQQKGPVTTRVWVGKSATTYYIDPEFTIT